MGHYDSCYDADAAEAAKKRHKEIKKDLIDLINKLDDDERRFLITVIKNLKEVKSVMLLLKKLIK